MFQWWWWHWKKLSTHFIFIALKKILAGNEVDLFIGSLHWQFKPLCTTRIVISINGLSSVCAIWRKMLSVSKNVMRLIKKCQKPWPFFCVCAYSWFLINSLSPVSCESLRLKINELWTSKRTNTIHSPLFSLAGTTGRFYHLGWVVKM